MNAARVDVEQDGLRISVEAEGDVDAEVLLRKIQAVIDALAWDVSAPEPPPFDDETLPVIHPGDDPTM